MKAHHSSLSDYIYKHCNRLCRTVFHQKHNYAYQIFSSRSPTLIPLLTYYVFWVRHLLITSMKMRNFMIVPGPFKLKFYLFYIHKFHGKYKYYSLFFKNQNICNFKFENTIYSSPYSIHLLITRKGKFALGEMLRNKLRSN